MTSMQQEDIIPSAHHNTLSPIEIIKQKISLGQISEALIYLSSEEDRFSLKEAEEIVISGILSAIFLYVKAEVDKYSSQSVIDLNSQIILKNGLEVGNKVLKFSLMRCSTNSFIKTCIIKSQIGDMLGQIVSIPSMSEQSLSVLLELAKLTPEIFTKQMMLKLQRCLIPKSSNDSLRMQKFLLMFKELCNYGTTHYKPDSYFYIQLLKNHSFKLGIKINKLSAITACQTLKLLAQNCLDELCDDTEFEDRNTNSSTFTDVLTKNLPFENKNLMNIALLVKECIYPRLCLEFQISNPQTCEVEVQKNFFELVSVLARAQLKPVIDLVRQSNSEWKNLIKECFKRVPYETVELLLEVMQTILLDCYLSNEQINEFISEWINWNELHDTIQWLTEEEDEKQKKKKICSTQLERLIIREKICDFLISMIEKGNQEALTFFINEFIVGQLCDVCSNLDFKRKTRSSAAMIRILKYISCLPKSSFSTFKKGELFRGSEKNINFRHNQNSSKLNSISDSLLKKEDKIEICALADLFDVVDMHYYTSTRSIPTYYQKMHEICLQTKEKLKIILGNKMPCSLSDQVLQSQMIKSNIKQKKQKQKKRYAIKKIQKLLVEADDDEDWSDESDEEDDSEWEDILEEDDDEEEQNIQSDPSNNSSEQQQTEQKHQQQQEQFQQLNEKIHIQIQNSDHTDSEEDKNNQIINVFRLAFHLRRSKHEDEEIDEQSEEYSNDSEDEFSN